MVHKATLLVFACALAAPVLGDVPAWGQCGGVGYTGSTVCTSPYVCTFSTTYYSECLPATTTTTTSSSHPPTTSPPPPPTTTSHPPTTSPSPPPTTTSSHPTTSPPPPTTTTPGAPAINTAVNPFTIPTNYYFNPEWPLEIQNNVPGFNANNPLWSPVIDNYVPLWLNQTSNIATLAHHLDVVDRYLQGWGLKIVIYNLPNRNCATKAQPGEFTQNDDTAPGDAEYLNFISQIYDQLQLYPDIPVIIILEPHSLSLVAAYASNGGSDPCSVAAPSYTVCPRAARYRRDSSVAIYLDGGDAALISTPALRSKLALIVDQIYISVSSAANIRGLATNLGGYNAFNSTTAEPIFAGNAVFNELLYAEALAASLTAPAHFIVDTSRSGRQGIRAGLGDWCNVQNAGFGLRPTISPVPGNALVDALVWAKEGGESDGTSDAASPNYDPACARADAAPSAPEYGAWMTGYFNGLISNAFPPLVPDSD